MNIYIKSILIVVGLYPFILLFNEIYEISSIAIKQLFCKHDYRYWKVHLKCKSHSGINDTILNRWRKCDKCNKQQELSMIPGNWNWRKSNYDLPESTNTVVVNVKLLGETETLQEKRDRKINSILKK